MILDTNAVSALFDGDESLETLLANSPRLSLPTVVVGEYRYGLARSSQREHLTDLLETLIAKSSILSIDLATSGHYSIVKNELRDQGTPIPDNDLWIASLARQHAQIIVSRDRHFDHVPGVLRREW